LSPSDITNELNKGSDAIRAASGVRPGIARAPYGAVTADIAKQAKAPFIGWSVSSKDMTGERPDDIYNTVMSQVKPGAIIEAHDIRQETADAYKRIIPDLITKGYTLVTVPQLLDFTSNTKPEVYSER
jgi:peptidoglycan/xylan/chitin deacetylase (PgdA/CDA1 family)